MRRISYRKRVLYRGDDPKVETCIEAVKKEQRLQLFWMEECSHAVLL